MVRRICVAIVILFVIGGGAATVVGPLDAGAHAASTTVLALPPDPDQQDYSWGSNPP